MEKIINIFHAIILGIVQGLTEFIPVSSSGHLVLLQKTFGIANSSLFFDVMLHAGTLLAVFFVFKQEIWTILRNPFQKLTLFLIIGTIPTIIIALIFRSSIENLFFEGRLLGFSFLLTACLLCSAEILSRLAIKSEKSLKQLDSMTWRDALTVGLMQAIAIFPGVSRSGATITGALGRKLSRDLAARFSFLLSIPAILGALVLHLMEMISGSSIPLDNDAGLIEVIAGTLSAAVVGYFAIRFMLKMIRERSLFCFAIYTAVLGIFIIIDQAALRLIF